MLRDFDALSLYPSATWDKNSIYPRIETGYAFARDMNDELLENLNTGSFTQGCAILKTEYYNPKNLIVQHLPVKERVKKMKLIVCKTVTLQNILRRLIFKKSLK